MRAVKSYPLSKYQSCNTVLATTVTTWYIRSSECIHVVSAVCTLSPTSPLRRCLLNTQMFCQRTVRIHTFMWQKEYSVYKACTSGDLWKMLRIIRACPTPQSAFFLPIGILIGRFFFFSPAKFTISLDILQKDRLLRPDSL